MYILNAISWLHGAPHVSYLPHVAHTIAESRSMSGKVSDDYIGYGKAAAPRDFTDESVHFAFT